MEETKSKDDLFDELCEANAALKAIECGHEQETELSARQDEKRTEELLQNRAQLEAQLNGYVSPDLVSLVLAARAFGVGEDEEDEEEAETEWLAFKGCYYDGYIPAIELNGHPVVRRAWLRKVAGILEEENKAGVLFLDSELPEMLAAILGSRAGHMNYILDLIESSRSLEDRIAYRDFYGPDGPFISADDRLLSWAW